MTLAQSAYESYAASTGGKTYNGNPMPTWAEIVERTPHVAKAWADAASTVARITENQPNPHPPVPTAPDRPYRAMSGNEIEKWFTPVSGLAEASLIDMRSVRDAAVVLCSQIDRTTLPSLEQEAAFLKIREAVFHANWLIAHWQD